MTPIQLVLVASVLAILLLYFRRLRRRLFDRLSFLLVGFTAIVMVARPDWSTTVAQFLGVERGADLVTYLGLVGLGFLWLLLYTRQREMDEKLTELIRKIAILEAREPNE